MNTYYTIYKITNQMDGKIYIGSHKTKNLNDNYMGSGKYLLHAQNKYGIENFTKEILFVFETPEEMYSKEAEIVNEDFLATENTYNLKIGGLGGFDHINKSEKNIYGNNGKLGYGGENLSKSITRDRMVSQGRYDEWRLKISAANKGKPGSFRGRTHSEETINKLKCHDRQTGDKNSQYGTMWITNGSDNRKISKDFCIPDGWKKGRSINNKF